MERIPRPGEFYRHFKDKLYQVITIARHTESDEPLVIYQALYGDFGVYARPLAMFVSEVDHEKYPDVVQKYRFEKVEPQVAGNMGGSNEGNRSENWLSGTWKGVEEGENERPLSPLLLPFVEAKDIEHRLEILAAMRGKVGQEELDILYVSLDLPQRGGDVEAQLDAVEKYLQMQLRFEGKRLR